MADKLHRAQEQAQNTARWQQDLQTKAATELARLARLAEVTGLIVLIGLAGPIGGGGSATPVMNELFIKGFPLSAGVLSAGDSDWAAARRLGLSMVEEAPFSPIREDRHRDNLGLIERSSAVVLAPLFVGPGNLLNVEAAGHALKQGLPVFVIDEPSIAARDFTGGRASLLYAELKEKGAVFVSRLDLLQLMKRDNGDGAILSHS